MQIKYHKLFVKDYRRLDNKIRRIFKQKMILFVQNPYNIKLNNHPLRGKWQGYRSVNITGDYRAVYKIDNSNVIVLVACGTHSKLYR